MNLASDPWLPTLTRDGMRTVGLVDALTADVGVLDISSGDPLEDAAIMRLLVACDIAAADAGISSAQWVDAHRDRFDLFDPVTPFWQHPRMAAFADDPKASRPVAAGSYRLVGNGSTAAGDSHNEAGIVFTPAEAARMLLVRHMFSVGGIQSFVASAFGKEPMSAKNAVGTSRGFVWVQGSTLLETLELSRPATGPVGTFHFSWPDGIAPATVGEPEGMLDALTWQARAINLLRNADGMVDRVMICDGVRWPEPGHGTWTAHNDEQLIPHATYIQRKASDPFTAQDVHVDRPVWRQLLTAWTTDGEPGLLGTDLGSGTIRMTGLGSFQARIDGAVTGSLPVPAFSREDGRRLLAAVTAGYSTVASTSGSLAHNRMSLGTDALSKATTTVATAGFKEAFGTIVTAAATATISVDDACAAITDIATRTSAELISDVVRVDPVAAARTLTRPAKNAKPEAVPTPLPDAHAQSTKTKAAKKRAPVPESEAAAPAAENALDQGSGQAALF
ncbi:type I-E CRISPR-associated protein Cse1/CasA [Rhodococcus baikonurensis]|uniref:Type I-E CRISPR-associated protein Cse1/CasA n=1 Tax=Rhodococcus baikonurensis TaxID=172041 RepID=A0ABV5XAX8_9NOCA